MKFRYISKKVLASVMTVSFIINPALKLNKEDNKYVQYYILPSVENEFGPKEGNGFNKIKRKKRK